VSVVSLACSTSSLWAGDVYKTVDAQGHVIYSDQAAMPAAAPIVVDTGSSTSDVNAEVRANEAPPQLPDSEQPPCPEEGYLWTPGYWAWGPGGYYWVPGAWVQPPRVGVLWTPGYWAYVDAVYFFHRGYWASHIGYYGGVNYGFGYFGVGYAGGHWEGNSFAYNRAVSNVNEHFHNVYHETVEYAAIHNRVSYNGGPGGSHFSPSAQERAYASEPHIAPTSLQRQSMMQAAKSPALVQSTLVKMAPSAPSAIHANTAPGTKPAAINPSTSAAAARSAATPPSVSQHAAVARAVSTAPPPQAPKVAATPPKPATTSTHTTTSRPSHPLQH
jgi:hypothetical protein